MSGVVHGLHSLSVVGEADLSLVVVEVLISEGPGFKNVSPNGLYKDSCELLAR